MQHRVTHGAIITAVLLAALAVVLAAAGPHASAQVPPPPSTPSPAPGAAPAPTPAAPAPGPARAPIPAQPAQAVQLTVSKVERGPAPPPTLGPTATSGGGGSAGSSPADLFVYVRMYYTRTDDVLHFNAGDVALLDAHGVLQSPGACDASGKLPSKTLLAPSAAVSATVSTCLHYSAPVSGTASMALEYMHTEQAAQPLTPTVYHVASLALTVPAFPTPRRVYAAAAGPALRAYLLDAALAGGYVALNVDPLYAGGADATVPGAVRASIGRQAGKLAADRRAFLAVNAGPAVASDKDAKGERSDAEKAFTALERDLAAVGTLRTAAGWASWRATLTADNDTLAGLYDAWPATLAPQ